MKLLSIEPISNAQDDIFDFHQYVEQLGNAINHITKLPYTVGIYGEYGAGKTSLMRLLSNWLIENDSKTLWFDPWVYNNNEQAQGALIRAILLKIYQSTTIMNVR